MADDRTLQLQNVLADKIQLSSDIGVLRSTYRDAKPFPHVVIDNLFPERILDSLLAEMSQMRSEQWSNIEQDARERTARMRSAAEMGAAGQALLSIVHSAAFLYFLSEVVGIEQLLPDPYLQGAGYALMRRGDYFNVHADRNVAYDTGLTRRLAMIIFLNKSWSPQYHGRLELWSPDGKRCEASVEPLFNKTIIFEVAYPNFHGVPTPLACPSNRVRQSFITYYHTAGLKEQRDLKPHTSIFAPRFYGTNRVTLRSVVRDLTPPLLARVIRRLSKFE
jgi:Rps23 Pro-64 3,4-dihydroxylase Tpa1-like proline 4-hydroxylase